MKCSVILVLILAFTEARACGPHKFIKNFKFVLKLSRLLSYLLGKLRTKFTSLKENPVAEGYRSRFSLHAA